MRKSACFFALRILGVAVAPLMLGFNAPSQALQSSSSLPQKSPITLSQPDRVIPMVESLVAYRLSCIGCIIYPVQIDVHYVTDLNGVDYRVTYRRVSIIRSVDSQIITDVRTVDHRFRSPEGLRIGDIITISKPGDILPAAYFAVYANQGKVWVPIISEYLDNVVVVDKYGKEVRVPLRELTFTGNEIHVRITGFAQRAGVDFGASPYSKPSSLLR